MENDTITLLGNVFSKNQKPQKLYITFFPYVNEILKTMSKLIILDVFRVEIRGKKIPGPRL